MLFRSRNTPKLTFAQGSRGTINMELTLDTTATGEPVTTYTGALLDLMKIDSELPDANTKRIVVNAEAVREKLKAIVEDEDLRRYIL